MEKTNPSFSRYETWTFRATFLTEPSRNPGRPAGERLTPLQYAQLILDAIRPFPDAYQAMLQALRHALPLPNTT